jgi:mono/diheme cytochrome c family protein
MYNATKENTPGEEIVNINSAMKMAISATALAAACLLISSAHAQDVAEKTYKAKCAGCHAVDGSGSAVGKKLGARDFRSDDVQKMSDAELTGTIAKGKNKMPSYEKTLKPDDIKGLVAYIRTLAPKK